MFTSDDLISVQGNIYTLVDKDGYLVRENAPAGERVQYSLSGGGGGGGTEYSAGSGLILNGTTFSIDGSVVATQSYVNGLIGNINSILDTINGEVI